MSGFDENRVEDTGIVTAVDGSRIKVEIQRGESCGSCSMRGFCFKKADNTVFELHCDLPLKVGDRVYLEISPGARIGSALLIFGLPLLMLFLGFMVASRFLAELPSVATGFGAMALSFVIVGILDKRYGKRIKVSVGGILDHKTE